MSKNEVIVYTKDYCPYCTKATDLLTARGIPYKEIELTTDKPEDFIALVQRSGMKTVPQIFFGEKLIGGYSDLAELDQKDSLKSLKI